MAFAQTPAPPRDPRPVMPSAIISRLEARVIIDAAIAFAEQSKSPMGVVVVDQTGEPIATERMDGGSYRNMKFAEGKAFAAAIFGQTTEELGAVYKSRPDRYFGIMNMYPGKVYLVGGGEPIVLDGKLVGAVGVAGLPEGVDEKAGRAGIAAWLKYSADMKK
jgi:glc operon protein GlcG